MTTITLIAAAILLFVLMGKAIRTLMQDAPGNRRIAPRLQPRLDGDTET